MRLSEVKAGDTIEVTSLPNPIIRAQAIRLGIYEGAIIRCSEKINNGPVVLQNRLQEIAIGHKLASQIIVEIKTNHTLAKNKKKGPSLSYGYK